MQGLPGRNLARQARADFRDVRVARVHQIGPLLQIARILRRNAIDDARMRGRNNVFGAWVRDEIQEQLLHRLGVLIELDDMIDDGPRLVDRERFEVRKESPRLSDIAFGILVEAAMNGVVGTLEQQRSRNLRPA